MAAGMEGHLAPTDLFGVAKRGGKEISCMNIKRTKNTVVILVFEVDRLKSPTPNEEAVVKQR